MLSWAVPVATAMLGVAMALSLWRLARGPDVADRILALDTLSLNAIGLLLVVGVGWGWAGWLEAALLLAGLGFAGTVALAKAATDGKSDE